MSASKYLLHYTSLIIFLIAIVFSCTKDDPAPLGKEIDFSKLTPAVTAKGTPTGGVYTQQVGAGGGRVQSPDGQITIDIPAGALSANTSIGIQPITNQAPLGVGSGYRLTPEGTVFAKPVRITMKYGNDVPAPFAWIVTQQSNGTWLGDRNSEPDEATKTVSVQTTHFSDWGVGRLVDLQLAPQRASVKVKETLKLGITGFYSPGDDDLMPLVPIHRPDDEELAALPDLSAVGQTLVKLNKYSHLTFQEWRLDEQKAPASGSKGKLEAAGSVAAYTAPDQVPAPDEVSVSVYVQAKDKNGATSAMSIITPIRIVKDEYFLTLYLDGKKIEYIQSQKAIEQGLGWASIQVRDNELHLNGRYDTQPEYTSIIGLHINDKIEEGKKVYQRDKTRTPYTTLTFTPVDRAQPIYVNESAKVTNDPNAGCFQSAIPIPVELTLRKTTRDKYTYYEGSFSAKVYYVSSTECLQPEEHTLTGVFNLKNN